ncbi:MAG: DUF5652 family protein [Patescibacteria group bacterium]
MASPNVLGLTWLAQYFNVPAQYFALFGVLFYLFIATLLLLKGLALWRAARMEKKVWFWCILIINTMGILDIIFLLTHREENNTSMDVKF